MTKTSIYQALGNDTRLSIVRQVIKSGCEVSSRDILTSCSEALELAQPTLSQHFARLVSAGVLTERKAGVQKFYKLNVGQLEDAGINIDKL